MSERDGHDSREARVHAAIADACFGVYEDEALVHDVAKVLAQRGVSAEDAREILEKKPRFWLYRELIWNNVHAVVKSLAPRACAMLDERAPNLLASTLHAFLRDKGIASHHFRDVPYEFFAWARPHLEKGLTESPALAIDLFAYELFAFEVAIAPRAPRPAELHDVAPDRALVFEAPAILAAFECKIHEYEDGTADPPRQSLTLLGYRDRENEMKLLELTPFAATIVRQLQAEMPLAQAIPEACKIQAVAPTPSVMNDVAKLLADLATSEIILGAR